MLYQADAILNQKVEATDGVVGIVKDLYFDDASWTLRYLVVDTGGWLTGRDVLISCEALERFDPERSTLVTRLSQEQIENSPPSDTGHPISRLSEIQLSQYYGWSPYWTSPAAGLFPWSRTYKFPKDESAGDASTVNNIDDDLEQQSRTDPNLRSFVDLKNYGLRALDGDIGEVEDLLIEPETWQITHLVADVRLWWPGGLVVIDCGLIENISWTDQEIAIAMTRDQTKAAPEYDKHKVVTEELQTRLSDYYGGLRSPDKSPQSDISIRSWIPEQPAF